MVKRQIFIQIQEQLSNKKSVLLLGPRQVGKTTLAETFHPNIEINLAKSKDRLEYEKDPSLLDKKIQTFKKQNVRIKHPLVFIDEVQLVPELLSEIQVLIDQKKAQFLLTGSSARKLREHANSNLIPGRIVNLRLDSFSESEFPQDLEQVLAYGQLPEIALTEKPKQKSLLLRSYVENYIEEEIRKETKIRNVANYARFIELAAIQAGEVCNFSEISKELGPTVMTIQSYFQILEDTLFADRIDPYLKNATRKKLTKASRYLFYDLGVRRVAAKEGSTFLPDRTGKLFEQFVGMELLKWIRSNALPAHLYFWRDPDGPEVDWLIELDGQLLPCEVKLSKKIGQSDARHLRTFMSEYNHAHHALIINNSDLIHDIEKGIEVVGIRKMHEYLNGHFKIR
jgi:predicted AAA+ superfamily ATPase